MQNAMSHQPSPPVHMAVWRLSLLMDSRSILELRQPQLSHDVCTSSKSKQ